jgi:hypothetical protein
VPINVQTTTIPPSSNASSWQIKVTWNVEYNNESIGSDPASITVLKGILTLLDTPWNPSLNQFIDIDPQITPGVQYIYQVCFNYIINPETDPKIEQRCNGHGITIPVSGPIGSYQKSCRGISFDSTILRAECQRMNNGPWTQTQLNITSCVGDIYNADGVLGCGHGNLPAGSYQQSCLKIQRDGNILRAECLPRESRIYNATQLDITGCVGDIYNADGQLGCEHGNLPAGSYQQSCRDRQRNGNALSAECRTESGAWTRSAVDITDCVGDIYNADGQLGCGHGNLPAGSYQQSCRNIQRDGNLLRTWCRTGSGSWTPTLLNITDCVGDIYNADGQLGCGHGNLPAGSYQQSCRNSERHDHFLFAECRTRSGSWTPSQLDLSRCSLGDSTEFMDIGNDNGNLKCRTGSVIQSPTSARNCSSSISLWTVDDAGNKVRYKEHGPFSGWTPLNYAGGKILWKTTDNRISLWTVDDAGNKVRYKEHGPFSGWTPLNYKDDKILWLLRTSCFRAPVIKIPR